MDFNVLRVNLTKLSLRKEKISSSIVRKFIGGRGLGVKILYDEVKPGIDPLSPDNKLIFATGPVASTIVPTGNRFHIVTKSPLTGGIGESNCGGSWGAELRSTGFNGIIIEGKSDKPVYLWIKDGEAELRDASHLWGKTTWSTENTIREELGVDKAKIVSIGPAGENLVLFAAIINDKHRAAGRCGVGAVMGSKNLKAIAVKGSENASVSDEKTLKERVKECLKILKENEITGKGLPHLGTPALVSSMSEVGMLPSKNFREGVFPDAEKVSGETLSKTILVGRKACKGCPIGCGRKIKVTTSPYQVEGEGPEYETIVTLGPLCGVSDLNAIAKAHNICDEMGLDGISLGGTIACAMELNEKGKIPSEKLEGLSLTFGNPQCVVELAFKTAFKVGFGEEIASGSKRLAEKYGAPELAMQVKGLELPAYDPRGSQGHALGYATSNRGGCHLRAYMISPEVFGIPKLLDRFTAEGKAEWVIYFQNLFATLDSMVICKFLTFALDEEHILGMFNAVTGWNWSKEDLLKTGERIYNLERLFINREGFKGESDTLPKRFLEEPLAEGNSKGVVVQLKPMLEEYYKLRSWENGAPSQEKIRELELT
ncbi:MAG: aldehyde ferredoxin oxidoreductase family protein [Candidatus Odinarchaeia archaeon]